MCGISVRQLGYWTKQGYVTAQGQGERRVYGLDALRRILAIRRFMAEGNSLGQSLKSLPGPVASRPAPVLAYTPPEQTPELPAPEDVDALAAALVKLFDHNCHVRDSADGLAVKLGLAPAPVRYVADALCARGKTRVQDEAVYQRLEGSTQ